MTKTTATQAAYVIAAIITIGIIVLVALNKTIPSELWYLAASVYGAAFGISIPSTSPTSSPPSTTTTTTTPIKD